MNSQDKKETKRITKENNSKTENLNPLQKISEEEIAQYGNLIN